MNKIFKKTFKFSLVTALIIALSATTVFGEEFIGRAEILLSSDGEYQAVRLVPEIYNHLNRNLSDILIKDEAGNVLPYFINSYDIVAGNRLTITTPLVLVYSFIYEGDSFFDYKVETITNRDTLATSLLIQTNSNMFAKSIELWGSHDGAEWRFVQHDSLYRVDGSEKLAIYFSTVQRYTHYRIKIPNDGNNDLLINGMVLEYSRHAVEQNFFSEPFQPAFDIVQDGRNTVIELHGLRNVRINELTIHTNSRFQRPVSFANGRTQELYNLNFASGGQYYRNLTLNFGGYSGQKDIMPVTIHNGDNIPIDIENITLTYFADEIIFEVGSGTSATLFFGNSSITRPPVYDIVNYKAFILTAGYEVLPFQNIVFTEEIIVEPRDFSFVFNIVLVAISVLLGFVILIRLRRQKG